MIQFHHIIWEKKKYSDTTNPVYILSVEACLDCNFNRSTADCKQIRISVKYLHMAFSSSTLQFWDCKIRQSDDCLQIIDRSMQATSWL